MTAAADIVALLATASAEHVDPTVWWRFLGRLHPLVVHFPLALLLVAAGLESLLFFRKGRGVSRTAVRCLMIGAASAGLAAWLGWLNADYEPRAQSVAFTVNLHRWLGIAAASTACLAVFFTLPARFQKRWAVYGYRWLLLIAAGLVAAGGFFGGELVHGRGYLLAVFREPAPTPPTPAPQPVNVVADPAAAVPVDFATEIRPIFAERCSSCHVPDKRKGDLVLVPISAAFARPPAEWVIQPGHPDRSPLLMRVRLPADHADRMPREGDPLTDAQIALLARWIAQGAAFDALQDPPPPPLPPPTLPPPPPPTLPPPPPPVVQPDPPAPEVVAAEARESAMVAIRERGGTAVALAEDRPDVEVSFRAAEPKVTDADLGLLQGLDTCLTRLDLSGTAVTDAGIAQLAPLKQLARLRLDHTAVTDAGVKALAALDRLAWLNLVATKITDASVDAIAAMQHLEQVYLWDTGLSASGRAHLRRLRPDIEVVTDAPPLPAEKPREPPEDEPEQKEGSNEPAGAASGNDDPT